MPISERWQRGSITLEGLASGEIGFCYASGVGLYVSIVYKVYMCGTACNVNSDPLTYHFRWTEILLIDFDAHNTRALFSAHFVYAVSFPSVGQIINL